MYLELVGQTEGFQDVEIRARVEGFLESMNFREGSFVKQGDAPLRDRSEAARGDSRAGARPTRRRPRPLAKANNDVARYTPLVAKQAVSQQELDDAQAEQDAARSQVEAAKAAVEKATLDLGYTRVTSPISGLVGTTQVKPGNLVGRGENTLLTTISQIDPILFRVGVTEADYLRIARRDAARMGARRRGRGHRADARRRHRVSADRQGRHGRSRGRSDDRHPGRPDRLPQSRAAPAPGPVRPRARSCSTPSRAPCWCRSARCRSCRTSTAWRWWTPTTRSSFRNVKVGPRVGSLWVIEDGLKPGEQVVVEGLQRIQEGMTVGEPSRPPAAGGRAAQPAGEAK